MISVIIVDTGSPGCEKVGEETTDGACDSGSRRGACIPNPCSVTRPANFKKSQLTYYPAYYSSDRGGQNESAGSSKRAESQARESLTGIATLCLLDWLHGVDVACQEEEKGNPWRSLGW